MNENGTPYEITTVVSHGRCHEDEYAARAVAHRHGQEHFTGLDTAKFEAFDPKTVHDIEEHPDERWWFEKGYLFIGVGHAGWSFVDHPHKDHPNDCAFTLMLKYLGLYEDPAWKRVGAEVLREDRNGARSMSELAPLIKAAHEYMDPIEADGAAMGAVEFFLIGALYRQQQAFQFALKELDDVRHCRVAEVKNQHTKEKHQLCVVQSESAEAARAARFRGAALVVQFQNWGNDTTQRVYISSNKKLGVRDLRWLAAHLRWAEQKKTHEALGSEWQRLPDEEAAADGMLFNWYHQEDASAVYNRTPTAMYVPRTLLSLREIVDIAKAYLHDTESIRPSQQRIDRGGRRTTTRRR